MARTFAAIPGVVLVICLVLPALFVADTAVSSIVRATPSDRALATIAIVHGVVTTIWATVLAFDPDGMWGAHVSCSRRSR